MFVTKKKKKKKVKRKHINLKNGNKTKRVGLLKIKLEIYSCETKHTIS
jgi:hypothetical protein